MPALPGRRATSRKQMREQDSAGQAPARIVVQPAATSTRRSPRRRRRSRRATRYHYNGHLPIGPACCVADVTPNGARDLLQHAGRLRHAAARQGRARPGARVKTLPLEPDPRHVLRGLERVRLGALPRRARRRRRSCRSGRQAGAAPVHALGRARLGQLRPGADDGHPWRRSTRTATSSRSTSPTSGSRTGRRQPPEQQVAGKAVVLDVADVRDTTISGTQYSIPNRRVIGKTLPLENNYFKVDVPAGAERAADGVRRRADDRRARPRGEHGPGRVPAPEHRQP